jgi:amidase
MLKSLLSTEPWVRDPVVPPIPWRQLVYDSYLLRAGHGGSAGTKPLKFGVLWHDGIVKVHPPVERGLRLAVDAIAKAGHKVAFSFEGTGEVCQPRY